MNVTWFARTGAGLQAAGCGTGHSRAPRHAGGIVRQASILGFAAGCKYFQMLNVSLEHVPGIRPPHGFITGLTALHT